MKSIQRACILALGLFLFLLPGTAMAQFHICNETEVLRIVAIGYQGDDDTWTSEGWWQLDPGECNQVMEDELTVRYMYYRAESRKSGFEGEGYKFCTSTQSFTIEGDTECEERGYLREDFAEVDTRDATEFTVTLVETDD